VDKLRGEQSSDTLLAGLWRRNYNPRLPSWKRRLFLRKKLPLHVQLMKGPAPMSKKKRSKAKVALGKAIIETVIKAAIIVILMLYC
jgi:hypothetical protein